MITILSFLAVIGILIIFHELGHFFTAKAFGIKILEFGLGYPPRLASIRKGDTVYSLNLLPLGGFVKLLGEEDPSHPQSFASKGVLTRAIVLCAGSFMNLLLPIIAFAILFMIPTEVVSGKVTIISVAQDSPAERAGLKPGDVIQKVHGREIRHIGDLDIVVRLRMGAETKWEVLREPRGKLLPPSIDPTLQITPPPVNPQKLTLTIVPRFKYPEGQGPTGIVISTMEPRIIKESYPIWSAIPKAAQRVVDIVVLVKNEITTWIVGTTTPQLGRDLTGPIGIARLSGEVAKAGILPLVEFGALISISLAVMNILPIPALDGGRLLFVAIEWVRRGKRISPQKEGLVHLVGFVMLIILIGIVSYFDISRIIQGESLLR